MSEKTDGIRGLNIGGRAFRAVAPVAAFALLTGCSQIPDAVNPVEWYNNTVEFFSGEDEEKKPAGQKQEAAKPSGVGKAPSAADKPFPKLSSVDQQADYYAARKQGLVADTEGRKYAPAIARQGEPTSRLAATPPPEPSAVASAAPAQPAPPAQPAQPVPRAPAGPPPQVASLPTTA
ncbi:MAG: hypothetical protein OXR84_00360, partial [Magnetovibrio sp.]|nr:hypothetical protein [Magnetovibrio sp.]